MTDWAALRRTIEAATPGPWHTDEGFGGVWVVTGGAGDFATHPSTSDMPGVVLGGSYAESYKDADFVVLARTAMPEMLALLEEAREALALLMSCTESGERLGYHERIGARALIARLPQPPRRQWRDDPDER